MAKEMTRVQVLREFFFRTGVDTLQTFMGELKALSAEEKTELATLAAIELGVTIKEV